MSFEPNYFEPISFEPIAFYAAETPVFARSRETMSNVLIYHNNRPRRQPKRGRFAGILRIPC